jgi:hypothetical protein
MIHSQNSKFAAMLSPISVNGTAATTTEVDTLGYDYATVIIQSGALGATMDELSVGHSDTSGSGFAAITGGTFVDPVTSTDDNKIFVAFIDLRKAKRYLKLVADPGAAASLLSCVCVLERAEVSPTTATERGLAQQLIP